MASDVACDGACCALFPLSAPYQRLLDEPETIQDGDYLADMLVPLTHRQAVARGKRFDSSFHVTADREWFSCRHWDEKTRLCKAYESRPSMCRRYPYGRPCDQGCSCPGSA